MKTANILASGVLVSMLLGVSAHAASRSEPMYNFLPSDTVIENVKTSLQNHGLDTSSLQVEADAKGVVQLTGQVGSKQDAERATEIAKEAEGVYAVLGQWRYVAPDAEPIPVSEADSMIDAAPTASGNEGYQSEMQ